MQAPLGYLDSGSGKVKVVDPVRGPLIKRAFELYATGKYGQVSLGEELYRLGLRSRSGRKLDKNFLGRMLKNRFYMGIIHIKKANETFLGGHQQLVEYAEGWCAAVQLGQPTQSKDFQARCLNR